MSADTPSVPYRSFELHPTLLGEPLPPTISFETTNHCNLRCTHCRHTQYAPFVKGYLDEALFDKVAPHLGPGKIPAVNLSDFGEPFMSKGWWKIFDRARDRGARHLVHYQRRAAGPASGQARSPRGWKPPSPGSGSTCCTRTPSTAA